MKHINDNFKGNIIRAKIVDEQYYRYGENNYTISCVIKVYNPFINSIQSFKGVAKCNPDDTLNLKKGRHVAESRAKLLMFKAIQQNIVDVLSDTQKKYNDLEIHELNHIKELVNE